MNQTTILFIPLIFILFSGNNALSNLFYKTDLVKNTKQDPSSSQQILRLSRNTVMISSSSRSKVSYQNTHVGRVGRKRYEMMQMFSIPFATPTSKYYSNETTNRIFFDNGPQFMLTFVPRLDLKATTPSFIEFYYINEDRNVETNKLKQKGIKNKREKSKDLNNLIITAASQLNYLLESEPTTLLQQLHTTSTKKSVNSIQSSSSSAFQSLTSANSPQNKATTNITFNYSITNDTNNEIENNTVNSGTTNSPVSLKSVIASIETNTETSPVTTTHVTSLGELQPSHQPVFSANMTTTDTYDKIRFFEIYDKLSEYYDDSENKTNEEGNYNEINKHANQDIKSTYSSLYKKRNNIISELSQISTKMVFLNNGKEDETKRTKSKPSTYSYRIFLKNNHNDMLTTELIKPNSEVAKWSDYSFAAVYIYKPSQVYCDAAGISAHWLLTSGSCLSRHHKYPGGQGLSAYVSYCSDQWWSGRVSYVKYSVVHPRFHPRLKDRKYLYNIGLIQVVTSMATSCKGWTPVSIMSHQLFFNSQTGYAVGWGLNRLETRYSTRALPKILLSVYKSHVYRDTCPGSVVDNEADYPEEEGNPKNLYCLALPPYQGEDKDPLHGGMLLSGGKLIALYLQEERRPWGEQSAQYTGVWRLIPWILDVAKGPDTDFSNYYSY